MSLRKLVEGECGGTNSLVSLSSHFVQDRGLKDEGFHSFPHQDSLPNTNVDQLVHEFFEETSHSAQPFRMDSLLAEMRDLESRGAGPVRSAPISQLAIEGDVQEWAQQYLESGKSFQEITGDGIWSHEDRPDPFDSASLDYDLGFGPRWADDYLQRTRTQSLDEPVPLPDLSNSEEYKVEEDIAATAGEILTNTALDPRFSYSKFMKFMKQIEDREVTIGKDGKLNPSEAKTAAGHWSLEFQNDPENEKAEHWSEQFEKEQETSSKWTEQFLKSEVLGMNESSEEPFNKQLWDKLTEQWKNISPTLAETQSWDSEFNDFSTDFKEYNFAKENPLTNVGNPLEEGQKRLAAGDLPSAVLCFEVAAQQEPENPLAWQLLGTTQAENEQDPQAIAALKKCLHLQPNNLTALMALSVCYTNENFQNQACRALKEWLRMNPKYSDIVPSDEQQSQKFPGVSSFLSREMYNMTKEMFLEAARRNPLDLDPDVQCGLGVLFNISSEIDLAVDCFKAALQARPNDASLWNRLGATLANGDRSEEAVDAYRSALQLQPGFIRARYNLGITCVHLGAYREAAEHLLTALKQQSIGRGPQGGETKASMSDTIWNTLKLVCALLERSDLLNDLNERNLSKLNDVFGIE